MPRTRALGAEATAAKAATDGTDQMATDDADTNGDPAVRRTLPSGARPRAAGGIRVVWTPACRGMDRRCRARVLLHDAGALDGDRRGTPVRGRVRPRVGSGERHCLGSDLARTDAASGSPGLACDRYARAAARPPARAGDRGSAVRTAGC